MITRETIESLDAETQVEVRNALATLARSGIFEHRLKELFKELADGPVSETNESLLERIQGFRQQRDQLIELHELASEYNQEQTNADV
jgi:hypothetical protein